MSDNISNDYTLLNQSVSIDQRYLQPAHASYFIFYTGAPSDGDILTLTSSNGLVKTYEFDSDSSVGAGNVSIDISSGNPDTIYNLFVSAVNGPSGHDGELAAVLAPDDLGFAGIKGFAAIIQATGGSAGNKSVDISDVTNAFAASENDDAGGFTGGVDEPPSTAGQFIFGTKSTINLRGQTTTSRYKVFLGEEKS